MSAQPAPPHASAPTTRLRVLPAPRTTPPSDPPGTPTGAPAPEADGGYLQGTLAVDFRRECDDPHFGPQATSSHDLPAPGPWAARMIPVILEVGDGLRPATQLTRWVAAPVLHRLARRGLLARQRRHRQRHVTAVRAMTVCRPADGVVEVSAVVSHDGRVKAVAARFSGVDGRWLLTALEVG